MIKKYWNEIPKNYRGVDIDSPMNYTERNNMHQETDVNAKFYIYLTAIVDAG
jgi:hypothetical protein